MDKFTTKVDEVLIELANKYNKPVTYVAQVAKQMLEHQSKA